MAMSIDWFPASRDEQLSMGKNWVTILSTGGPSWNIPGGDIQELSTLVSAADAALAEAKNEATRTPVATAKCKEAFQKMEGDAGYEKTVFLHPAFVGGGYYQSGT